MADEMSNAVAFAEGMNNYSTVNAFKSYIEQALNRAAIAMVLDPNKVQRDFAIRILTLGVNVPKIVVQVISSGLIDFDMDLAGNVTINSGQDDTIYEIFLPTADPYSGLFFKLASAYFATS